MGGKSTYLRQVALMCIMAQCGSFIPAASATLPILDRVFTRIGAGDSLAEGKSTFFVEMEETALITRQATSRSLVILDEVGRGTSTYDGLAIAQAVIEYIVTAIGARCLFATHYHELTKLSSTHPTVANYHVLCEQTAQGVLFLHRMVRGAAQGSFGLEVARLAQVPLAIVSRAQSILQSINAHEAHTTGILPAVHSDTTNEHALQATITQLTQRVQAHEALARMLNELNLDELSPRAAYDLLWQLKMKQ
jgi:DNA mismatch repair protein MutS